MSDAKKIPIGLQLYSIREQCAEDLPGTLKAVAEMGYDGVEFAGYYDYSAEDLRAMTDDLGLKICGTHIKHLTLLGDELKATVEFNQVLGNKYLIVPGVPREMLEARDACLKTAELFTGIAEAVAAEGMLAGYHCHGGDFIDLDGTVPWDLLGDNTPASFIMQFDVGNAMHGGAEAMPHLTRFPGRAVTVHLKEFSATKDTALIGEGDAPWDEILAFCESDGASEWYIVEQESYAHPPLECVDLCLQNLRKMGR